MKVSVWVAAASAFAAATTASAQDTSVLICAASNDEILATFEKVTGGHVHFVSTTPAIVFEDRAKDGTQERFSFTPIRTGRFTWHLVTAGWVITPAGEQIMPPSGRVVEMAGIFASALPCPNPD